MNKVLVSGGLGTIIALAFPVAYVTGILGSIPLPAMESDLLLTAAFGVVALLTGLAKSRWVHIVGGLIGVPVGFVVLSALDRMADVDFSEYVRMAIGPAVPITLVGAGAMLLACLGAGEPDEEDKA